MALLNRGSLGACVAWCGLLTACERVVPVAVGPVEPLLVVQARLDIAANGGAATSFVHLSRTQAFSDTLLADGVSGATVQVRDDAGRVYDFEELAGRRGVYLPRTSPVAAGSYRLQITWQGERYEAVELLPRARPIDRVQFTSVPDVFGTFARSVVAVDFSDPVGVDYYQWELYNEGRSTIAPDSLWFDAQVLSDSSFNGLAVKGHQPQPFTGFAPGNLARVRQATVSPAAGGYLLNLTRQRSSDGSPFARPPYNVRGNIVNQTTPTRRALGVFAVRHIWELSVRAP
jgi:hypothetical protein